MGERQIPQFFKPDYRSFIDSSGFIVAGDDIFPSPSIYLPINSGTFGIDGVRPDGTLLEGGRSPTPLTVGLVSYWELEEASGERIDIHASNNLTDGNTVDQAVGKVGNCAHFEDDNGEYLSSTSSDFDTAASSFTACGWYNFDVLDEDQYFIGRYASSVANRWWVRYKSGNDSVEFLWCNAVYARLPVASITAGTWYFITAWYDADSLEIGIQKNSDAPITSAVAVAPASNSAPFMVGNLNLASNSGIDGKIDQVGFWTRVLTSAEIDAVYNGGAGGTYNNIIDTSTPVYVSDKWGNHESALYMEITDEFVLQISDGDLSATKGSFYITYRPDYPYDSGGVDKYLISGADFVRLYYDVSEDRFAGEMWNGSDWTTVRALSIQQNFVSGTWIHLAMVYNNASGLILYLSGTQEDSVSDTWTAQTVPSFLSIGNVSGTGVDGAHGAIDNFKAFKRESDASEVLTIYGENVSLD